MTKQDFQTLTQNIVLLDGATGSNLMAAGMPKGVCTEEWVLSHKDVIQSLQRAYIEAGSNIIYAPTFGGNVSVLPCMVWKTALKRSIILWCPIPEKLQMQHPARYMWQQISLPVER